MEKQLKEVLDEHFSHVKFDKKLMEVVCRFQFEYINGTSERLDFFSGNLLGAHIVRFTDADVQKFFDRVIDVDRERLSDDIDHCPAINPKFIVSSDRLNITLFYVMHRFLTSPLLKPELAAKAAHFTALIFFYRCLAAILSDWFKFPADEEICKLAYSKLSMKFLIKKLGSWLKVCEYRANSLLDKEEGIHFGNIVKFTDDLSIVYAMNDSQGRIRELLKDYYAVFEKVRVSGDSIATTSSVYTDAEGEDTVKEKLKSIESMVIYAKHIIISRDDFVVDRIVSIIANTNSNTSFRMVRETLYWLSAQYNDRKYHNDIDEFLGLVIVYSMHLLENNPNIPHMRDYPKILVELKNLYLSTRSTDQDLIRIRELGEKLVKASSHKKLSDGLVSSTRTSVILYIILRVLLGSHKN